MAQPHYPPSRDQLLPKHLFLSLDQHALHRHGLISFGIHCVRQLFASPAPVHAPPPPLSPFDHQLIMYNPLSQGSSTGGDHASTTAQQGSAGTRGPPKDHAQGKQPRRVEHRDENKEDCMKHDLLGIGSQFEGQK